MRERRPPKIAPVDNYGSVPNKRHARRARRKPAVEAKLEAKPDSLRLADFLGPERARASVGAVFAKREDAQIRAAAYREAPEA